MSPSACSSERAACDGSQLRDLRHHGLRAPLQLGIGRLHVHHHAAIDPAKPQHDPRGDQVEHDLLRGARLHPRGAGDQFAAGLDQDRKFCRCQQRGAGIVGDTDRHCTARACLLQRRDREWRCPAGGDRDHHVVRREPRGIDLPDRIVDIVLRALDAGDKRAVAAGDDEADALLGQAKVGVSSAPSWTATRPEVPAPT